MGVKFTPNQRGIQQMFHAPGHVVPEHCAKVAEETLRVARIYAPVSQPEAVPPPTRKAREPGRLKRAHIVRPLPSKPGAREVVVPVPYALAVHNGRRAVTIPANPTARGFTYLRWSYPGGHVVYSARAVRQKARAGKPWLNAALHTAMRNLHRDVR